MDASPDDMVALPGGRFRMGSDRHYPEEAPTRAVEVSGFWVQRTTVTNAQFEAFTDATGYVTVAERPLDLLLGKGHIAALEVGDAELGVELCCLARLRQASLLLGGREHDRRRAQDQDEQAAQRTHACTAKPKRLEPSRTVTRSVTSPASWPHAASISSPRVRRTVAVIALSCSRSRKRAIASRPERRY